MPHEITEQQIKQILWQAIDIFRDSIRLSSLREHILALIFWKYISDFRDDENFTIKVPSGSDIDSVRFHTNDIAVEIDRAFINIDHENRHIHDGFLADIDFYQLVNNIESGDRKLWHLLEIISQISFRVDGGQELAKYSFKYLVEVFANQDKYSDFFTPVHLSTLISRIVDPKSEDSIYDPTCGSGSLLIQCANQVESDEISLYGQEINRDTYTLCLMNLLLHDFHVSLQNIRHGNTLTAPQLIDDGHLQLFDIVIANPPASLSNWNRDYRAEDDIWGRYRYGIPTNNSADYAFIQHIIASLNETGRAGVLVPNGVLYRSGAEGQIRKRIIEDNLIDAVISLPSNMLYSTNISTSLLVLNKAKKDKTVLFIDASNDYDDSERKNVLRNADIERIVSAYRNRNNVENYAYVANIGEVSKNDFELSVQSYIIPLNLEISDAIRTGCAKTYDIFISYSRKDTSDMKIIADFMREEGFSIWTDETLEVGTASWQAEIAKAIENTCTVIVLLSPDSKQSTWVLKELNYAIGHDVKIFPVIVRGSSQESVPLLLIDAQYHDFRSGNPLELKDLSSALKQFLSVEIIQPFVYDFTELIAKTGWELNQLGHLVSTPKRLKAEVKTGDTYPQYSPSGQVKDELDMYDYEGEHLLVARVTSNLQDRNNPIAFVVDGKFSVTNNVIVLKPSENVVVDYLKFAIDVIDLSRLVHGVIPSINKGNLLKVEIPVPSYEEQIEICEQAKENLNQIALLQNRYQQQIKSLSTNARSIVRRIFTQ